MKKHIIFLFFVFSVSYQGFSIARYSADSLGITTKNGLDYIVHEVDAGETLYALSRKYGIEVQSIKDANSGSVTSLRVGQKVLIPVSKSTMEGYILHTVKSSETLFSISRQYDVQVDDLKALNNLSGNSISVGQQLIIKGNKEEVLEKSIVTQVPVTDSKTHTVEQSQTLYSISRMYGVSADQIKEWNQLESSSLDIGQVLIVSSTKANTENVSNSSMLPTSESNDQSEPITETTSTISPVVAATPVIITAYDEEEDHIEKPAEKVVQKGFAEVIENTSDTKKYLAMHRDAPIGTIMQVKNEMNNQRVFVRIVNTIPPTGDNSKVILKISKKAYDRLGAVDSRFPVEISYIP